jgi:chemotaxis protein methyltransferase CheR
MNQERQTYFFQHSGQLEYLARKIIPQLIKENGSGVFEDCMVWNVNCSKGEQSYSLAMVLKEFSERVPGFRFKFQIIATDNCPENVEYAKRAIYHEQKAINMFSDFKQKYFLRCKDQAKKIIRIAPELRSKVRFRLLDIKSDRVGFRETMDVIVLSAEWLAQESPQIIEQLIRWLKPNGFLVINGDMFCNVQSNVLKTVAPNVYRKQYSYA